MSKRFDPNYYLEEWQIKELRKHLYNIYTQRVAEYKSKDKFKGNGKGRLRHSCNVALQSYYLVEILYLSSRRIVEIIGNKREKRLPGLCLNHINFDNESITYFLAKKNQVHQYKQKKEVKKDLTIIKTLERIPEEELVLIKKMKREYKLVLPLTNRLSNVLKEYIERFNIEDKLFNISRNTFDSLLKLAYKKCSFNLIGNKRVRYVNETTPIFKTIKGVKKQIGYTYTFNYKVEPKRIAAHIFRHSFAFNFIDKNANDPAALEKLRRILDHDDFNITKQYAHFRNEDLKENMESL